MLNERKIKAMTKLAIYEDNRGKEDLKIGKYYKTDYVRYNILKTLVGITFTYFIILGMIAVYNMEYVIKNAVTLDYRQLGTKALGIYCIAVVVYLLIALIIYTMKFVEARKRLIHYNKDLQGLRTIYKEEGNKSV